MSDNPYAITLSQLRPVCLPRAATSFGRGSIRSKAVTFPGYALIADPVEIFKGRVNQMNIEAGETATISLTVESRLVDWERPRVSRYNNADQQVAFSGDKGFEFVPPMVEKELIWGRGGFRATT